MLQEIAIVPPVLPFGTVITVTFVPAMMALAQIEGVILTIIYWWQITGEYQAFSASFRVCILIITNKNK
jgi:hypothetical protein